MDDLRIPVKSAIQNLRPLCDKKTQQITLTMPENELQYAYDPIAMQQAVGNLISNAIKFSPEGGEIFVQLDFDDDVVQIKVSDYGIGISSENQLRVFDRFFRYPPQMEEGSGLGLAICREIVNIHRGYVTVESRLGHGSTFTITLPLITTGESSEKQQKTPPQ